MEAGEGYRLLEIGEVIMEDDECWQVCSEEWRKTEWGGTAVNARSSSYRRKVEHPAQDPVFDPPSPVFKVGDRVRVAFKDDSWPNWHAGMDATVGEIGTVYNAYEGYGTVSVSFGHNAWTYRLVCLELATEPEVEPEPIPDLVNHPHHYNAGSIECIDAIRAALGHDGFIAYCRGNALKYAWRCEHKGGSEDLAKAAWYLNRAIAEETK